MRDIASIMFINHRDPQEEEEEEDATCNWNFDLTSGQVGDGLQSN